MSLLHIVSIRKATPLIYKNKPSLVIKVKAMGFATKKPRKQSKSCPTETSKGKKASREIKKLNEAFIMHPFNPEDCYWYTHNELSPRFIAEQDPEPEKRYWKSQPPGTRIPDWP
ncbi:hypothetical protein Clacol_008566 [Clathrus columnatus]|uniref:Uncharacterized protein n=1 Tax=Clathrus columnatus TaxID=1419009 RepID=A0AAV5AKN1_9AGAM|nr:hypothetical protein Clacol_008566 [Clathrus columnatus]